MENPESSLHTFLRSYPIQLESSVPDYPDNLFVFWSQKETLTPGAGTSSGGGGGVADWDTHQKIKEAFCGLQWISSNVLIQFWSASNGLTLSTRDQPFAFHLDPVRLNFRSLTCYAHDYDYGVGGGLPVEPFGPVANAFLNHIAGMWLDLRVRRADPLVVTALGYGYNSYFVLPVSDIEGNCVGVIDCYAKNIDELLGISISLTGEIKNQGLRLFQGSFPFPIPILEHGISGLKCEIQMALRKICESHDLTFAQASFVHVDPTSSSSVEASSAKKTFALRMVVPCVDQDVEDVDDDDYKLELIDHCALWDMIPLTTGNDLAGKVLGNYKSHFCSNIYEMTDVDQLPADSGIKKLSSLALWLKCNTANGADILFEFFWPRHRNHFTITESVISRLKQRLPNFKYALGAELEDQSSVTEVRDGLESEFNIFVGGKLDGLSLPLMLGEGIGNTSDIDLSKQYMQQNIDIISDTTSSIDKGSLVQFPISYKTMIPNLRLFLLPMNQLCIL